MHSLGWPAACALALACACALSCAPLDDRGPCGLTRQEYDIDGQRGLLLLPADHDPAVPTPLVIYHHGRGEDWDAIESRYSTALLSCALGASGYMVAGSHAHGDNWGRQEAIDDYVALHNAITAEYAVDDIMLLSASMGGLTGLLTIAQHAVPNIRAWAGISPVTNLGYAYFDGEFTPDIEAAYQAPPSPDRDPMLIDPAVFTPVPMLAWASYADTRVPADENVDPFFAHLGNPPSVRLIVTEGDHGDLSNFDPAELVAFFDEHRSDAWLPDPARP